MTFGTFNEDCQQRTAGRYTLKEQAERMVNLSDNPLPFDDIPQVEQEKSLLERLEEYEPKERLMLYHLLDTAGISASAVNEAVRERYKWGTSWQNWKHAITYVTGESWEEIAPIIYEGYL